MNLLWPDSPPTSSQNKAGHSLEIYPPQSTQNAVALQLNEFYGYFPVLKKSRTKWKIIGTCTNRVNIKQNKTLSVPATKFNYLDKIDGCEKLYEGSIYSSKWNNVYMLLRHRNWPPVEGDWIKSKTSNSILWGYIKYKFMVKNNSLHKVTNTHLISYPF